MQTPVYNKLLLLLAFLVSSPLFAADQTEGSAIDQRIQREWQTKDNPFVITPHRPSYILPLAYNSNPNEGPYKSANSDLLPEPNEVKFQFSFKVPLVEDFFFGRGYFSFGYTQQSYWQAYKGRSSSPFRETNYEPELLFNFPVDYHALGVNWRMVGLSLNHQSNGRSEPLSRSWNRVMLEMVAEKDDFYASFKPWWRIPESASQDDNPDIEKYMGNFELRLLRKYKEHTFGAMIRNNLRGDNYGAFQLDYTFRFNERLGGYIQYFNGYGESLIDYDHCNNRIGVGIMMSNWL